MESEQGSRMAVNRGIGEGGSVNDRGAEQPEAQDDNPYFRNGDFVYDAIAEQVRAHGSVDFEFSMEGGRVRPVRPYRRFEGADAYDIRDKNFPPDPAADIPSSDYHRLVRKAAVQSVAADSLTELVTRDGGVRKRILKKGTGKKEVVDGSRVWIHYDTYLDNGPGQKLIYRDSTTTHNHATSLEIGSDGLYGLQFGVMTMLLNEVAEFALSPLYAYGENGAFAYIGKNQSIRIIMELRLVRRNHETPFTMMTLEQKANTVLTRESLIWQVDDLLRTGKDKFQRKKYRCAAERYQNALEMFTFYESQQGTTVDDPVLNHKQFQVYSNQALAYLRLKYYEEALEACLGAVRLTHHPPDLKPKVIYRKATAEYKLGNFPMAISTCDIGIKLASWGQSEFIDLMSQAQAAKEKTERQGTQPK